MVLSDPWLFLGIIPVGGGVGVGEASLAAGSYEDPITTIVPVHQRGPEHETNSGQEALGSMVLFLVVTGPIRLAPVHLDVLFSIKYLPLGAG